MQTYRQSRSREAQAKAEIGHTEIGRGAVRVLCGGFLALILSVPILQGTAALRARRTGDVAFPAWRAWVREWRASSAMLTPGDSPARRMLIHNRRLLRGLQQFEDELEDTSVVGRVLRPRLQAFFVSFLGVGSEQVYLGRSGRLYYRADVDAIIGPGFLREDRLAARARSGQEWDPAPHPDPRPAILAFHRDLAARGIRLILMPTPGKPTVDPGGFARRSLDPQERPRNADYRRLIEELEREGVAVFDVLDAMPFSDSAEDRYLATDTHWRPETLRRVAEALARRLVEQGMVPEPIVTPWKTVPAQVSSAGDLAHMLDLPPGWNVVPSETVTIRQVVDQDDQFWRPDPQAEVLLLGDSFSNIFSLEAMGWGEAAGLSEHLSLALGRPLDRLVRNDAGAHATRGMLARELARGRDRLRDKRVVLWQFAEREWTQGDWRVIRLELGEPGPTRFLAMNPGEILELRGVVQDMAAAPRPGTVPYRNHIVALHLVDIEHPSAEVAGGEALVYLWSMVDNEWTHGARLRRGETVDLVLRAWGDVADRLDAVNRAELDDETLQLEPPCWGEILPAGDGHAG